MSYAEQGNLEIVVRGSKEDLDDFTLEKGNVDVYKRQDLCRKL